MTFEEIYGSYWQKVFRLCMGYVNDHDWAMDITQETFISVWQHLPKFRQEASLDTWIYRIASNQCLRQIERNNKMPKTELPANLPQVNAVGIEDKLAFLYQCISELRETDRLIISLELEDVKQAEIAKIIGLSEENIRVRIHRIKEKLSLKFKHYER